MLALNSFLKTGKASLHGGGASAEALAAKMGYFQEAKPALHDLFRLKTCK